jgi:hypothetical protein
MDILQLTNRVKSPATERSRFFISRLLEESELLRSLNNFGLGATDHVYRPAAGTQTLASRALGGNYTPGNLTRPALQTGPLRIHGFELDYDGSYERDHDLGIGVDIDQWLDNEVTSRAITAADAIDTLIMAGDGTGNNITGLRTLLNGTNVPGLGITCVINAKDSGNNFDLSNSANHARFMEKLLLWKADVKGANALICNMSMKARLTTIAINRHMYTTTIDKFGNTIERVAGMQIIAVDDTAVTLTEADDAPANITTSIYIFRNAEEHWTIRSNSGLYVQDMPELEAKVSTRFRFEFAGFNEIKTMYAIRRVRNIRL